MSYERVFYVVAAGDAESANRVLKEAGFGAGCIAAPLCASGAADGTAASHFWCSWAAQAADRAKADACLSAAGLEDGVNLWRLVLDGETADAPGVIEAAGQPSAKRAEIFSRAGALAAVAVEGESQAAPDTSVADFLDGLGLQRCVKDTYESGTG